MAPTVMVQLLKPTTQVRLEDGRLLADELGVRIHLGQVTQEGERTYHLTGH